jgi:ribonuclease P protein component
VDEQSRLSFPKTKRLTEKHLFDAVFKNPTFRTSRGSVRAKVSVNNLEYPRLGIIVAKRQFPRAVARNAVKRKIREGFRLSCEQLPGVDIVVQVFSYKLKSQLSQSLDGIWKDIMLEKSIRPKLERGT